MILVVCDNHELGRRPPIPVRSFQVPYFVRQPYVIPVSAPRQTDDRSSGTDILELAKNVLAFEAGEGEKLPFRIREPLRPGGQGAMLLELALDTGSPARTISLTPSDLSGTGSRIASDSIGISPSTLTLRTGAPADITVTVRAPPGARPGLYAGTVSATGDESFEIPFQVEVR
jgi:hypothetical protein